MQRGIVKSLALSCAGLFFFAAASAQAYDLPDFTALVDKNGAAVVNVQARQNGNDDSRADDEDPEQEQVPEIFRRFFGPGGPGAPGVPRGGRPGGVSLGSGFIISTDGYILTNNHVVDGADTVTVRLSDRRELDAKVVGSDAQYDIALLKVSGGNLPAVTIGDSKKLKPGQWVLAIGSPFGFDHCRGWVIKAFLTVRLTVDCGVGFHSGGFCCNHHNLQDGDTIRGGNGHQYLIRQWLPLCRRLLLTSFFSLVIQQQHCLYSQIQLGTIILRCLSP